LFFAMSRLLFRYAAAAAATFGLAVAQLGAQETRSIGTARVTNLRPAGPADLVVLDAGHAAGLRAGMVCTLRRAGRDLGEILLVELRSQAATALITTLATGEEVQPGDTAAAKTISR
jgi:hypothetical protein